MVTTPRVSVMSTEPNHERRADTMLTTFVFQVRNIPAALIRRWAVLRQTAST